jgi:hypothetical protein
MVFIPLIFRRIISEFIGKYFVGRCTDNITSVGKMITPSVPIPTSPAIVISLNRGRADGNVISLNRGRRRKGNFG